MPISDITQEFVWDMEDDLNIPHMDPDTPDLDWYGYREWLLYEWRNR